MRKGVIWVYLVGFVGGQIVDTLDLFKHPIPTVLACVISGVIADLVDSQYRENQ